MKEIWKDVKGYEGIYKVSNLGRVKSLARKSIDGRNLKERIFSNTTDKSGYVCLSLRKNNKMKTHKLHQIMAVAFLGHTPNGYEIVVDHIDNVKTNNKLDNLQVITHRQNVSKDKKKGNRFTGVRFDKRRNLFYSGIQINGEKIHLGSFKCELAAAYAYNMKLKEITNG
jgi:hypothetical protein